MIMTRFLLRVFFIILSSISILFAQSDKLKSFQFALTYNQIYQQDDVFSQVPRTSDPVGINLGYSVEGEKSLKQFYFNYQNGKATPFTNNSITARQYNSALRYTHLFPLHKEGAAVKYWFGGNMGMEIDLIIPNTALRYAWHTFIGLSPSGRMEMALNERLKISYQTSINLLGVIWRPELQGFTLETEALLESRGFLAAFFQTPYLSSFHNTLIWNNTLQFQLFLTKQWEVVFGYQFNQSTISVPRRKRMHQHQLAFGAKYTIPATVKKN